MVLEACERLVDFHAWPPAKIDGPGWLQNFSVDERPFALVLLSRFAFFADRLVDQLFRSAFQALCNVRIEPWTEFAIAQQAWRDFCDQALVTFVQGEHPNPSDSGWLFARKARQTLGIQESRLVEPSTALARIERGFAGPVIFVDDFVGSGNQFLETWLRKYLMPAGGRASFNDAVAAGVGAKFFYCNAICTEYGRGEIAKVAPSVVISTGNIMPARYSFVAPDSLMWPTGMTSDGIQFLETVSRRLGCVDSDGGEDDWRGFHKLGLGLAFEHSVPDATLPLFYKEQGGWTPLVRRS
jgi:hypothetical protein